MKKLIALILFICIVNPISYASDVLEFNVVGKIVATTCNIKTANQNINLGAWQIKSTSGIGSGVGSASDPVEYSINFDCPAGINIIGKLEGNQYDPADPYYIALEKSTQSANGIVIVVHSYDKIWTSVVYNENRTLVANTVEGNNIVKFRSFYRQVASSITPGIANSSVTLTITYE